METKVSSKSPAVSTKPPVKRFSSWLLTGAIILLPLGISIFILTFLYGSIFAPMVGMLQSIFGPLLPDFLNSEAFFFLVTVVLLVILLVVVGYISHRVYGRQLFVIGEAIVAKIPIVGWVYGSVKQIIAAFNQGKSAFKEVVLIKYPHDEAFAIAFLTNETVEYIDEKVGEPMVAVFMPTTPNPTSGFLMYIPKRRIVRTRLTVDQAFKLIISVGIMSVEDIKREDAISGRHCALPETEK